MHLAIDRDKRTATLTLAGPAAGLPADAAAIRALGASWWPLAAFRELDEALLELRHNEEEIGLVLLRTEGDVAAAVALDRRARGERRHDWFVDEVRSFVARTLRRLDLTARSLYALIEPGSCFAGTLFEIALAADRSYMLYDKDRPAAIAVPGMNARRLPDDATD